MVVRSAGNGTEIQKAKQLRDKNLTKYGYYDKIAVVDEIGLVRPRM
jgi:hypothetical protein